jgi:hypothetical protein
METPRAITCVGGVRFVDKGLFGVGRVGLVNGAGNFGLEDVCF